MLMQIFLILGWLRAVADKAVDPTWWSGGKVEAFVGDHREHAIAWAGPILDIVANSTTLVAAVVLLTQVFIATSLITGKHLMIGLSVAASLNLSFIVAGSTNPSVFYLLLESALLIGMIESTTPTQALAHRLRIASFGLLFVVVATAPFASSLDPKAVIEDPALVLATWAACAMVATWWMRRGVRWACREQQILDLTTDPATQNETIDPRDRTHAAPR